MARTFDRRRNGKRSNAQQSSNGRADEIVREARSRTARRTTGDPVTLYRRLPDPAEDFRTHDRMSTAFTGIGEVLEQYRRNWGRIGFASQNEASDLSDAWLNAIENDDEHQAQRAQKAYEELRDRLVLSELGTEVFPYVPVDYKAALPKGNESDFERTVHQEYVENLIVGLLWPVILGKKNEVPELPTWKDVGGNLQAYVYGYADAIGELSKAVLRYVYRAHPSNEEQLEIRERYVAIASSILFVLRNLRHAPGYVINNVFYDRFNKKLRWLENGIMNSMDTVLELRNSRHTDSSAPVPQRLDLDELERRMDAIEQRIEHERSV